MTRARPSIVFRADASTTIGTGHVMRCLTLATRLRKSGADVSFVSREHEGHLCDLIEKRGFVVYRLSAVSNLPSGQTTTSTYDAWLGVTPAEDVGQTQRGLGDLRPDWLVVDHYGIDARWERAMRQHSKRIMVIDDLANRTHDCDVLLDQNLSAFDHHGYQDKVPAQCVCLLGPTYALLAPEYSEFRGRAAPREGKPKRILVSFGGVDKDGLTLKTVDALLGLAPMVTLVDVVLSAATPQYEVVRRLIAGHPSFLLHDRVPSLAPYILAADFAIGASGSTNWERLCLGLPSMIVSVADNQNEVGAELDRRGLVRWLGRASDLAEDAIGQAVKSLLGEGIDPAWSERCLDVVDGAGADRVAAVLEAGPEMTLRFRSAELTDEGLLLDWANDPQVRRNAFNPNPIKPSDHRRWFRARLRDPFGCVLYIAHSDSGIPVGQVRFDRKAKEWEVSYALAPAFRGRKIGRAMLGSAIDAWRASHPGQTLVGQVKLDNVASRSIFEALGFGTRADSPDRFVFVNTYED